MKKTPGKYVIILSSILLFVAPLVAQGLQQNLLQEIKQGSQSTGVRGSRISLEEELRSDIKKKQQEITKLTEYVPLEGAVDENEYIVGPGDLFAISITGGVEEQYMLPVGADGFLVLPYTSGVKITGMKLADARAEIIASLSRVFREKNLTVSLVGARVFIAHITGHVAAPGGYAFTAADRIYSAIEMVGGRLPTADLSRVHVFRGDDTLYFDLTRYVSHGDIEQNPYLRDGDIVFIPGYEPGAPWVFISGGAYSDGIVQIEPGEDITHLIEKIGADREKTDLGNIALIRNGEEYSVNLLAPDEPVRLARGDSIYIPVFPDSVYVGGRVMRGGSQPYSPGTDYMAYIAMAGGIAKEGSIRRVSIIRSGKKMSPKKAGVIQRGDVIMVGTSTFYVMTECIKGFGEIASLATAIYVIGFRDQ